MEFKVGDRVRVIDNGEKDCFGLVGTIERTAMDFMDTLYYEVNIGKELLYAFWGNQLELYVEKEEDFIALDNKNQQVRVLTKEQIKLEELEQRIEKLEKEAFKPLTIKDGIKKSLEENLKISLKPSLLTEDERVILRNLDKDFKWIARDFNDELYIYEKCPEKKEYFHSAFCWENGGCCESLDMFPNLFMFIKSMDEPYNIEELLKGECGNDE